MSNTPSIVPGFLVDTHWLAANLHRPDLRLFDCSATMVVDPIVQQRVRPERAVFEQAHIPGARFIDIDAQLSDRAHAFHLMLPPPADFKRAMDELGVRHDSLVVIYGSGSLWWATRVWWMLRVYGFTQAHVLDGGLPRWQAEGRPVETGQAPAPQPGNFTPSTPLPYVADRADVAAAIGESSIRIVNALRPEQYSGAERPRKGRPGHIPTSVNIPAASLLDPHTQRFLDDDALRARFAQAGITGREHVIAYCGGGVSASFIAFALMKLGHPEVRLYDASLAEWACDPALPMQEETNRS